MTLGPNDTTACPSDEHGRNSLAHGRVCPVCLPDREYPVQCPHCGQSTIAAAGLVLGHKAGGRGWGMPAGDCPGVGMPVQVEPQPEPPSWVDVARQSRARYAAVLDGGAA